MWLLASPLYADRVPATLRAYLEDQQQGPLAANDSEPIYRSGAAGRPSSIYLIEPEMRRRAERGELQPTLAAECECLIKWLSEKHPQAHPAKAKTISNNLRALYKQLTSPK